MIFLGFLTMLGIFWSSRRSSDTFVYLLVGQRLIYHCIFLAVMSLVFAYEVDESEIMKEILYISEAIYFMFALILHITILAPTAVFAYFIYCPIYVGGHLI